MTRSRSSVLLFGAFVSATAFLVLPTSRPVLGADEPPAPAPAQPPAHAADAPPVNAPAADVAITIRRAFADLADSSADVRESARATLMGLDRRYLDDLRSLVEHSRPLRPAQATVL